MTTEFDIKSATWEYITKYIEDEIAKLHKQNESLSLTESGTASKRGEIKALRKLAKLPESQSRETSSKTH